MLTLKKSLLFFAVIFICSFTASAEDFYFPADQWGKANVSMPQSMRGLESIVSNQDNFEPIANFKDNNRYRKISKAVGRLDILLIKNGASACTYCTASLIAQDRLITNYHCIPGLDNNYEVKKAALRMEYLSSDKGGEVFEVELPALESNRDLDYSILKVKGNPGAKYGVVPVKLKKPEPSESLFIIHHPAAQPKRISRRNCLALADNPVQGNDFRHRCDTLPGSSGSLIFSDDEDFEIVALHKAGSTGYDCGAPIMQIQSKSNFFKNFSAKVNTDTPKVSADIPNTPAVTNTQQTGCISGDCQNGKGIFLYSTGDYYEGNFKDNKRHGQGTHFYNNGRYLHNSGDKYDGDKYVGEFKDDKRNGQGTFFYKDGSKYVGEFRDNKMHGQGTYFFYKNGTIQSGLWKDGKFVK